MMRSRNVLTGIFVGTICVFHYIVLLLHSTLGHGSAWSLQKAWDDIAHMWRRPQVVLVTCGSNSDELSLDASGDLIVETASGASEETTEDDGFRFPEDSGGQILSKVLPPSEKAPPAGHDPPAPRRHPPPNVEKPTAPLPPVPVDLPRLPTGKTEPLRPRPLPEELPIFGHKADPILPQVQTLPAGDRVRIPSANADKPVPVPMLARPATERAPLDDATTAASQNAALSTAPPPRATPAPYLKISVPDPFENRLRESAAPPEMVTPTHTGSRPGR